MEKKLIGLSGQKGSGKSTVARYLELEHHYCENAFADKLKEEVIQNIREEANNTYGGDLRLFIEAHKYEPIGSPHGWVRQMLQAHGMMRRDLFGEDYWINKVRPYFIPGHVISDVRFPNEAAAIRRAGGVIWRIERPFPPYPPSFSLQWFLGLLRGEWGTVDPHPSEQRIEADLTIRNDGDFATLYARIEAALQ